MSTHDLAGWADDDETSPPYNRTQALADGALVDVSPFSKQAGIKVPVAVTAMVWTFLSPSERDVRHGQSHEGRLRDVLLALRESANDHGALVLFDVAIVDFGERSTWRLQAVVSAGELGEPVVTIMFPHES